MNPHTKEQIAFALVQHAPVPVLACHVLVHVQVEEDTKMSFIKNF